MIEDEIEVQLTYVEDVRNIWVSKVEDIAKVDQVVEKLSASPNLVNLPSVALGQLAMAKSEEDGSLGRVKVERVKGVGFGVVRAICKKFDGDVYLTARDEARGLVICCLISFYHLFTSTFHRLLLKLSRMKVLIRSSTFSISATKAL